MDIQKTSVLICVCLKAPITQREMTKMKQVLFLVLFLIGFSNFAFSQTADIKNEEIKFSVCRPQITDAGRQSHFQFSYRYRFVTDENGLVKDVKEVTDNRSYAVEISE